MEYFIKRHSFQIPESKSESAINVTHDFLICKWPQYHPAHQSIGKPIEVLRPNLFESYNTIIPLENISLLVVSASGCINDESILFVIYTSLSISLMIILHNTYNI